MKLTRGATIGTMVQISRASHQALQLSMDVNPISIQVTHEDGKHRAADKVREHLPK